MRQSVYYRGLLGGPSSMGRVGHALVRHLLDSNHYRVGFVPWDNNIFERWWSDEIRSLVCVEPEGYEMGVQFCSILDAQWPRKSPLHAAWLFYELAHLPKKWVRKVNTNDLIFVPSEFCRRVFESSGVRTPIQILGHGVAPGIYRFRRRKFSLPFRFLCVAEHTPRKNLGMLIKAFESAFQGSPDVELHIKAGLKAVQNGIEDLRQGMRFPGTIQFINEFLVYETDMAELFRSFHCFVLATRSEGFGMPILEAMATGCPVIVTDYGGHLDFCHHGNSYLIRNRGLVDNDADDFSEIRSQWADPDPDHLVELMRRVFSNYGEALEKGRTANREVKEAWTWKARLSKVFPWDGSG